jgi:hypothetical protein
MAEPALLPLLTPTGEPPSSGPDYSDLRCPVCDGRVRVESHRRLNRVGVFCPDCEVFCWLLLKKPRGPVAAEPTTCDHPGKPAQRETLEDRQIPEGLDSDPSYSGSSGMRAAVALAEKANHP